MKTSIKKLSISLIFCVFLVKVAVAQILVPQMGANSKWGFIDVSTHKMVVEPIYDSVGYMKENMAWINLKGRYGYVNNHAQIIVPCIYNYAYDFNESLALIVVDFGKHGFIDTLGNTVIYPKYSKATSFYNSMASVKVKNKWGFIDKDNQMMVQPLYSSVQNFSPTDNLAAVKFKGKWGFINKQGEVVIPFLYSSATDFMNGFSWVTVSGVRNKMRINTTNEIVDSYHEW